MRYWRKLVSCPRGLPEETSRRKRRNVRTRSSNLFANGWRRSWTESKAMDHEFNNRIDAQRRILEIVNQRDSLKEELFGLSSKAIERWASANRIDPQSQIVKLLRAASG